MLLTNLQILMSLLICPYAQQTILGLLYNYRPMVHVFWAYVPGMLLIWYKDGFTARQHSLLCRALY